jgi:cytochrome c5
MSYIPSTDKPSAVILCAAKDDKAEVRVLQSFRRYIRYIGSIFLCLLMSVSYASTHKPAEGLSQAAASDNPGESIYQQYCALCHEPEPQIPLGAPRLGVAADWQQRDLSDSDALFNRMDEGMGAMPPRGGCFECSDELLQAAIDYLLVNSGVGN